MAAVKHNSRLHAVPVVAFGSQTEVPSPTLGSLRADPASTLPSLQSATQSEETWDVVGLGQGMVDFSAQVDDALLQRLGVEKGARRWERSPCQAQASPAG